MPPALAPVVLLLLPLPGAASAPDTHADGPGPLPFVVNQALAARFWPGESGVGKELVRGQSDPWRVVGVAGDVQMRSLRSRAKPVARVLDLQQAVAASMGESGTIGYLVAAFAGLALLLSAVGLLGVVAYARPNGYARRGSGRRWEPAPTPSGG